MRNYRAPKSPWILLILLLLGGLMGSLLGTAFGDILPLLNKGPQPIGFAPTTINLMVIDFTIGVQLRFNGASIVGFLLALLVYFRI